MYFNYIYCRCASFTGIRGTALSCLLGKGRISSRSRYQPWKSSSSWNWAKPRWASWIGWGSTRLRTAATASPISTEMSSSPAWRVSKSGSSTPTTGWCTTTPSKPKATKSSTSALPERTDCTTAIPTTRGRYSASRPTTLWSSGIRTGICACRWGLRWMRKGTCSWPEITPTTFTKWHQRAPWFRSLFRMTRASGNRFWWFPTSINCTSATKTTPSRICTRVWRHQDRKNPNPLGRFQQMTSRR